MADSDKIRLGQQAATLLASPEFSGVVEGLRRDLILLWSNSTAPQTEVREQAYYLQSALNHIVGRMQTKVDDGKVENEKLIREEASAKETNERRS